jgi:hypothetical protein
MKTKIRLDLISERLVSKGMIESMTLIALVTLWNRFRMPVHKRNLCPSLEHYKHIVLLPTIEFPSPIHFEDKPNTPIGQMRFSESNRQTTKRMTYHSFSCVSCSFFAGITSLQFSLSESHGSLQVSGLTIPLESHSKIITIVLPGTIDMTLP